MISAYLNAEVHQSLLWWALACIGICIVLIGLYCYDRFRRALVLILLILSWLAAASLVGTVWYQNTHVSTIKSGTSAASAYRDAPAGDSQERGQWFSSAYLNDDEVRSEMNASGHGKVIWMQASPTGNGTSTREFVTQQGSVRNDCMLTLVGDPSWRGQAVKVTCK